MASSRYFLALLAAIVIGHTRAAHISPHVPHQTPDDRIIGGKEAKPHSAPYMAFIATRAIKGVYQCGGSLISQNYVLTAAHCLKNKLFGVVLLGAHNIAKDENSQVSLRVDSLTDFKIHPTDDIALIRLPRAVRTNENITPVKLPSREDVFETYANANATAFGWGLVHNHPDTATDVLRTVDLKVLPSSRCTGNPKEVCTSGKGIKGTCNGDSGGPLIVNGTQIGITSWGAGECELGYASVYVFVNKYLDWIENNTDAIIS